jgi:ABC-type Zn uptake system ZnuABC Zn-binding protein ZnuA/ABC-type Mn2+/Zn2+ transport system permease subunit
MASLLSLPFVQRGLVEVALLAVVAGVLGTWIVLRGLPFYVHATGTAAVPGLVLADGLAFSPVLGALATAALFAGAVALLGRRDSDRDAMVAVLLAGCLAAAVLLASDVFHSGARVDTLLFGSLLLIAPGDLVVTGAIGAVALACAALLGGRWLARGFDEGAARGIGLRSRLPDAVLLGVVALASVSALQAIGGLLVSSLFVVPAATTRLLVRRVGAWQLATIGLAAAEGAFGLLASVQTNTPPGAAIAVTTGTVFGLVALARAYPRRAAMAGVGAVLAVVVAGCGGGAGGPTVVATTTQLADIARNVAGGDMDVVGILRPNSDPHEYEPRPGDVRATASAEVVLESGAIDGWMDKVVDDAGGSPRVIDVGASVPVRIPGDPHWWHDPRNVEAAALRIAGAMGAAEPAHAAAFRRNARAYAIRVRALDARLASCFARVPRAQRKLVTDHDAFGYFAARYGIAVIGAVIPSTSTQGQASAGDVARLAATIRRAGVRAVFPESSVSPKVARALARETATTSSLTLYGDTLGPKGSRGATYEGMEQANADAMVRGFTGGRVRCSGGAAR